MLNITMSTARDDFMKTRKLPRFNRDTIDAPNFTTTTQSGRVAFDERGNSIWEWQTAPGVFSREISSQQLKALEASNLQVVDEAQLDMTQTSLGRQHTPRKLSKHETELVMPMRSRPTGSAGFEGFVKRLGLLPA